MQRHGLTNEQWKRIKPHLPGKRRDPGRTAKDNRRFVEAVLWLARTGAPWRDLPARYGRWNSVFQRYNRWCKRGVWQRILAALGGDVDLEHLLLDSTTVRAHQHAAGAKRGRDSEALGRSRGGWSTKIHAAVNGDGRPVRLRLTGGNRHDMHQAQSLLAVLPLRSCASA